MKPLTIRRSLTALTMGALMLLNIGCETAAIAPKSKSLDREISISRGTSTADLIALLGEPTIKKPLDAPDVIAEVWTYDRTLSSRSALEVTGMQSTTHWNPFTREMVTVERPVTETKVIVNNEVTKILIVDGAVHNWSQQRNSDTQLAGNSR